jgi:hypothetical protein
MKDNFKYCQKKILPSSSWLREVWRGWWVKFMDNKWKYWICKNNNNEEPKKILHFSLVVN